MVYRIAVYTRIMREIGFARRHHQVLHPDLRNQKPHAVTAADSISRCTADVKALMIRHNQLLNENKTEATVICALNNRKLAQSPVNVDVRGCPTTQRHCIVIPVLGVTWGTQIRRTPQHVHCQPRSNTRITQSLSIIAYKTIVNVLLMLRLLFGLPDSQLRIL